MHKIKTAVYWMILFSGNTETCYYVNSFISCHSNPFFLTLVPASSVAMVTASNMTMLRETASVQCGLVFKMFHKD